MDVHCGITPLFNNTHCSNISLEKVAKFAENHRTIFTQYGSEVASGIIQDLKGNNVEK